MSTPIGRNDVVVGARFSATERGGRRRVAGVVVEVVDYVGGAQDVFADLDGGRTCLLGHFAREGHPAEDPHVLRPNHVFEDVEMGATRAKA